MDTLFSMKVFCQVVQSGSFTRAADLLDISTPMASKHVAHLEKHIAAQLLYRNNRSLKLTEQGETYYRDCVHALELLGQAAEQAAAGKTTPQGTLRVSAPVWFACDKFARMVAAYQARYPEVDVVLTLTNRHVDLNSDGEDLALRLSDSLSENIIAKRLGAIPFYLVATPVYLAQHGTPKTPQDLAQHNVILPTYTDMSQLKLDYLGEKIFVQLHGKTRSNHTQMVAAMIRSDAGIGYMPAWLADDDLATGKLVRLLPDLPMIEPPLYAVYANRQFMKAKVRSFIDFMAEHCA
ncbi:LysR family transcriptional regulator [Wielerella bovis]|uniref:LysR family transcriptional regulator n=1 Tax=Wielerella bovis TaxID=2917790 RepID=UPI002019A9F6|nr:LysR family transcriptional regulator [Wielerella bovis]MCG7657768.1 LysR family transcriptional regulator [Wielerella bovis]MCG7659990.1 LysR family transcriptional regulator [Wielerella bovis]